MVQHHGAAPAPQRRKLRHVLIVTGPSGAGKSTFLDHLASRMLQPDILAHLPQGSERWTQIQELAHAHWMAELKDPANDSSTAELAMHYDMTHTELAFIDCFERDPALQVLRMAETATIIHIRPTSRSAGAAMGERQTRRAHDLADEAERCHFRFCRRRTVRSQVSAHERPAAPTAPEGNHARVGTLAHALAPGVRALSEEGWARQGLSLLGRLRAADRRTMDPNPAHSSAARSCL